MKKSVTIFLSKKLTFLILVPLALAGCSTQKKPEVILERGWMGGQAEIVKAFPKQLAPRPKAGILLTALSTNTPAFAAGLREGDVILSLNNEPITRLKNFRKKVEAFKPGAGLTLSAVRAGKAMDYNVTIGSEKYRRSGMLSIYLPIYYSGGWNLWPTESNPGISLIVLGYELGKGHRPELHSVKNEYVKTTGSKNQPYEADFKLWFPLMEVSKGKSIVSQELAVAQK